MRNGASTLGQAIGSIALQDFPHRFMEMILVDDGSVDETLSIVHECAEEIDIKVIVFSHSWQGLGPSRNVVVNNAAGEYIVWVDSDMILPKDHVRKQVEFMDSHPNVGIAKARYGQMDNDSLVAAFENIPFILLDIKEESLCSKLPGTGGAVFRVDAVRQVGGFDSKLTGVGEDQDIAYRIREAGWLIRRSPAFFYERRQQTWYGLWRKWKWYGYGDNQLYNKNRNVFSLFRMNSVSGFTNGLLQLADAYRMTHKISVLLLPFHYAFRMTAWCTGFALRQTEKTRGRFVSIMRFERV